MNKRFIICCILCVIVVLLAASGASYASEIKLVLDNKYIYTDTPPIIVDGHVMVPVRAVFEALGGKVEWNPDAQEVYGYKGAKRVWLNIDNTTAYIGNREETHLDVPAKIIGGRTMVPLRFIAETLGFEVNWDAEKQIVFLKSSGVSSIGDVFNLVKPALLLIETESRLGKSGSGFFITEDSVVTNAHVVTGAYDIKIKTFNSKYYDATIDRIDAKSDLAILKINAPGEKFQYIYMYKTSNEIKVGQDVIAIGNPFGLENTVSSGIISGIREEEGSKLIHMTAPISPGSSGGPLLTMDGEVIGVNTMQIVNGQNLNFAIPMDYYETVKNKNVLVLDQEVQRYIKAKSQWYAKRREWVDKFEEACNKADEDRLQSSLSIMRNEVLPKIEENRRMVSAFSTQNSEIKACVNLWSEMLDSYYTSIEYLVKYCEQTLKGDDDGGSLNAARYYLGVSIGIEDSYNEKNEKLWKKYYN